MTTGPSTVRAGLPMLRGMDLSTRARRRIATALALVLAVESVSAVSVAAATVTTAPLEHHAVAAAPAVSYGLRSTPRPDASAALRLATPEAIAAAVHAATATPALVDPEIVIPPAHERRALPEGLPSAIAAPAPKPASGPRPESSQGAGSSSKPSNRGGTTAASYRGRNHVWIPSLGISRSVSWFPCSRTREPDNYMYRWGCAGANNVYLMGHAYSIMKPLHDAYVNGRLRVGMKAWYADGDGRVRVYAVRWWKLTRPTTDAAWAWAAQDTPSMTLQTCVGKNSEWRIMVRLTEVDG